MTKKGFAAFWQLLPIVFKASPGLFTLCQLSNILHGISWGLITITMQRFFDTASAVPDGSAPMSDLLLAFAALGLAYLFSQVLNGAGNFIPQVLVEQAGGILSLQIHRKMGRISPIRFEDTATLDDINKAEQGKNHAVWFILLSMAVVSFYVPYFVFFALYLLSLKPVLALGIALIFLPTALTQLARTHWFARLEDKSAPIRREYAYYENCVSGRETFKETRMLGGFAYFRDKTLSSLRRLNQMDFKTQTKTNLMELGMKLLTLAGYFGILYMIFDALMKREITVGAFAAVFAAVGRLFSVMEEIVCRHFGSITRNMGTIRNFMNFLAMEEHEALDPDHSATLESSDGIPILCAEGICFAYPGSTANAVDRVSFTIRKGETVAIVGENGSGKSTLVRLLAGLYLPDRGEVRYGGHSTRDIFAPSLYDRISAVFQKYQRYQLTLKENIAISDTAIPADHEYLDKVTRMSGLAQDDTVFSNGYDTLLSREFGGTDLSGGQWQKIAIARGLYRDHQLIILDEPTAAIDPLEETRVYERFIELSKDKTAIIVTHRLGSTKIANRIFVMKKGSLIESGTHSELMDFGGAYAKMYRSQQFWYQNED
jgi:ATP-binding cassette, subfamily B, bacterial